MGDMMLLQTQYGMFDWKIGTELGSTFRLPSSPTITQRNKILHAYFTSQRPNPTTVPNILLAACWMEAVQSISETRSSSIEFFISFSTNLLLSVKLFMVQYQHVRKSKS